MKVALLSKEFPPEVYGGAGVHVEHLAEELAALVDVAVHCFGAPRPSPLVAATYPAPPELPAALQAVSVDVLMAAGVQGADLVHSHTWYANLAGHLAKLLHGIPHVLTSHSLEPLRPWKAEQLGAGYAVSQFCERTALEAADAIIAVSGAMKADIPLAYPSVDPDRITVIHNGVDADAFRPDPRTDVLEQLGLDDGRPLVLFVGRITRQKGISHLLDAAPVIDRAARLVLCAAAPDTDEEGAELAQRIAGLQAGGIDVVWIEEPLPRSALVQLLSHARVFVCPSVYEPFGLVNVEAMACEAAVVASAVGGIPEIVDHGVTGYVVPFEPVPGGFAPADPAAFARALADHINDLVADAGKARRFGIAGRRRVLEQFSWPAIARRTAALYEQVLDAAVLGPVPSRH